MNNTSVYLSNARLTPSSYYRLAQYFADTDATVHSALPDRVYHWWYGNGKYGPIFNMVFFYVFYVFRTLWFLISDVLRRHHGTIIICRVIVPRHLPLIHKLLFRILARRNQMVWDFDDNIIENKSCSPADFRFFSRYCDRIVVTNDFLRSLVSQEYADKVVLLPTTDGDMLAFDPTTYLNHRKALFQKEIQLVWVATASGLEYIESIIPALDEAAKYLKEKSSKVLTLHVVCNKPLTVNTNHIEIVNIPWSREVAKQEMLDAHIGIMPLPDTPFTRGKGGFKLIQYMSACMPVIGSDVGFNAQIVTNDMGFLIPQDENGQGWQLAIVALTADWETYLRYAQNARKHYDNNFSYQQNKAFWKKICNEMHCN